MRLIIRLACCLAAALVTSGPLAGCSSSGGAANTVTRQLEQRAITVDSVPAAEEAGLYVAEAEGFFAQQGLTVQIISVTGGETAIPDLQSGRAQLVAGNYVSFILAQMAGAFGGRAVNMRIIAAGSEIQPGSEALYVMPASKYQTIAQLAQGHGRVGVNTLDNVGDVMLGALLTATGHKLSDIREVVPSAGFPALIKMLAAG
jgi:NitT/TauT family transport system substrate-binding protein